MRPVALALGSNLGDRGRYLADARERIVRLLGAPQAVSRVFETDPIGPPGQGAYLNQVVLHRAALPVAALLAELRVIESDLGRVRTVPGGARTIDIDILLCADERHRGPRVTIPHPRLQDRAFVLVPLAEVWPDWRHPVLGTTVREMLAACDRAGVRPWRCAEATCGGWEARGGGAGEQEEGGGEAARG